MYNLTPALTRPGPDVIRKFNACEAQGQYNAATCLYPAHSAAGIGQLKRCRQQLLARESRILKFDLSQYDDATARRLASFICQGIGDVVLPVPYNNKLWYTLSVKLSVNPIRTHGTGVNPFHVDYLTREFPPKCIAFFGIRPDPMGGGQTSLGNVRYAVRQLKNHDHALLSEPYFTYFKDASVRHAGKYLDTFAIIPEDERACIRYTFKMQYHLQHNPSAVLTGKGMQYRDAIMQALNALQDILRQTQVTFLVGRHELYLFNQLDFVHCRQELGPGQETLAPKKRRLLLQAYIN